MPDGVTWTQMGVTSTLAGTTSVFVGTAALEMGARNGGTGTVSGSFYRAIVKNGIEGTTVLDVDCSQITSGSQTSFLARTGQTVSITQT